MNSPRLLDGFAWTHSSATDVSRRFRDNGWNPPEQVATEAEQRARYEGALQVMKWIQAAADTLP